MKHDNNFDFVRLFAAFLVLVSHQFPLGGRAEPMVDGISAGHVGVAIFFSISEYLIAQSWSRSPDLAAFVRARLTRIWPGCAVVTLLAAFVLGPLVSTRTDGYFLSSETWRYLRTLAFDVQYRLPGVFVDNPYPHAVNGSLWTIPLELTWYAVIAALGVAGLVRRRAAMVPACLLVVAYVLQQRYTGKPGPVHPLFELGSFFAIGAALATVRGTLLERRREALFAAAIVAAGLSASGLSFIAQFVLLPVLAIGFGEARTPILRRVGRFGDVSYGFYLYAFPVQQTVVLLTGNTLSVATGIATSAAITLLLAFASWRLVEKPAMRWRTATRSNTGRGATT